MRTVDFTQMKDGTQQEYLLLHEHCRSSITTMTADRVLRELRKADEETIAGYRIAGPAAARAAKRHPCAAGRR